MRPELYAEGTFKLKLPWSVAPNKTYRVIAIRTFEDIYKAGMDVYKSVYVVNNCSDGVLVDGAAFSFEAERNRKPEIITLFDVQTSSIILVPTTFILSTPDQNIVKYEHVCLTISLGAIPEKLDLTALKADVSELVKGRVGINSEVAEVILPSASNPTPDESIGFEAARTAMITNPGTFESELIQARNQIQLLQTRLTEYERVIRNNGLIP